MNEMERDGFAAVRATRVSTQHLVAPPDKVFPLLCPTREYEWIPTWRCRMVYSTSGVAERDAVFVTDFPGEGEDVWVVSVYRPDEEIQFARFNGARVIRYTITLRDNGDGTTTATWTQVITGLNEQGNRLVENLTAETFGQRIKTIERLLNHFLTTGEVQRTG